MKMLRYCYCCSYTFYDTVNILAFTQLAHHGQTTSKQRCSNANNVDITNANKVDITNANKVDITNANKVDITNANKVDITNANKVDITNANKVDITNANKVDITLFRRHLSMMCLLGTYLLTSIGASEL